MKVRQEDDVLVMRGGLKPLALIVFSGDVCTWVEISKAIR